jgi:lysophospholipase L1-like esterase
MGLLSWLRTPKLRPSRAALPTARLTLEQLEDRCVPAVYSGSLPPAPGGTSQWQAQDDAIRSAPKNNPAVIFMGDSITQFFADGAGAPVWQQSLAGLPSDDFGIAGNFTWNVQYQIENGDLTGYSPSVVVLMIGINDLAYGYGVTETAAGVMNTVADLRSALPNSKILLLGILPAHQSADDPIRAEVTQVNTLISQLNNGSTVRFLDVGSDFLEPDGSISSSILGDYVHPTQAGYQILLNAIQPTLNVMLTPLPVPAEAGMFDPSTGTWFLRDPLASTGLLSFTFGATGWKPVVGDWNGDGTTTVGVYNPANASFYLRNENSGGTPDAGAFQFGAGGWEPVSGDWSGSGTSGVGVFDPSTATWYLRNETSGGAPDAGSFQFGAPGWIPLAGDWTGSGHTGVGVYDPSTSTFYLKNTAGPGAPDYVFQFGAPGWQVTAGDFTGMGRSTVAVVDPSGNWYVASLSNLLNQTVTPFAFGLGEWAPLVGNWVARQSNQS